MKLLVVEDERKLAENIARFLSKSGFTVDIALDGDEGLDLLLERDYDCLILDILLPGMNGLEICKYLREEVISSVPILILTAMGETNDRIEGLEAGADDYLSKPFDLRELLARIKALIRRNQLRGGVTVAYGKLELDSRRALFSFQGNPIDFSSREFSILELLMRNPGMVFSREEITGKIWDSDYEPRSNIVDVYIRYIRKKLEPLGLGDCIETVKGKGYKLVEKP